MTRRLIVLIVLFVGATGLAARALRPELVPLREPLRNIPLQLDRWTGADGPPFTKDIMAVLGVDEYITRNYTNAKEPPIGLYIGYYQSQREGDTIHSPMNCLPGAGWQPMQSGTATITVAGRTAPIEVNRYVIQKGADKQLVLYWYQSHGRVIASEYKSKIFMVLDAIRMNRSDAALVRVISPLGQNDSGAAAEKRATEFVQTLFPLLERFLPS